MTITNDERREVAARLRAIDDTEWTHPRDELRALDEAIGTSQRMPYAIQTTWERLADLIEPERTCHNFGGEEGTNGEYYDFACDACGFCCDLSDPNYCPNCGCKVID